MYPTERVYAKVTAVMLYDFKKPLRESPVIATLYWSRVEIISIWSIGVKFTFIPFPDLGGQRGRAADCIVLRNFLAVLVFVAGI